MAFEAAPLLIGLREGLEALLVLGILLGMLDRLQARDRRAWVWLGFGAGIVVSIVAGWVVQRFLASWFEERGGAAAFEIVVALSAVAVLTYMVLWMQRHASTMVAGLKQKVQQAVTQRQMWVLAFLGFITVVREGLEVVLFFSALADNAAWSDIILWGTVGFAASAVLAYGIFALTVRVDVRRFFAVTGLLLIFIAAGLLVHVAHAAMDLGWLPHGEPLWDTSGTLPDEDHWLGGPLHAFVGYEDQPTLLQLLLYTTYLLGVGGWYLASLRPAEKQRRSRTMAAVLMIVLLLGFAVTGALPGAADHDEDGHDDHAALYGKGEEPAHLDHKAITQAAADLLEARLAEDPDFKLGLLVRSHGEPIHYNASTYESFKQFMRGIWSYTGLPSELLTLDQGTYFVDDAHPFSRDIHTDPDLVDAWLDAWELPAAPVDDDDADGLVASFAGGPVWFTPGAGPGMGEPDIFEMVGIGAYRTWLKMDNHSPMFEQNEEHFDWLTKHLQNRFGDAVVVEYAHHIDPKVGDHRTLQGAAKRLAEAGVDMILDSYHSSVFSDSMNGCMMGPNAQRALRDASYDGPIVPVGMAGTHAAWGEAVAAYLQSEADHFAANATVTVYLAQHGGDPTGSNPCGSGPEQYHENNRRQYDTAVAVLQGHFGDRYTFRHVYGQGAGAADDGVLSPMEALVLDAEAGADHVVIIPYEFWGDAMDNLVNLRESLGFGAQQAPYYDGAYETHTTYDGIHIDVWSAHYGIHEKGTAHLARISEAIERALG